LKAAAVCGDAASRRRGVRGDRIGAAVVGGAAEGGRCGGGLETLEWTDRDCARPKRAQRAKSTGQDSYGPGKKLSAVGSDTGTRG
jgi:hypothetical protein